MPKGPEIPDRHQAEGQPGLQAGMAAQPVTTGLPTQHGGQDVLTLEEYTGVGKLRGKVAVITGGDSGIGRAAAVMMAKEKLKACAIAHMPKEQEDADETARMLKAEGCEPILVACDLAEGESVCKHIVDQVVSKYGKVDILVNNAAEQHVVPSVTEVDAAQLEHTFKVNVFPMFYLAKHVVPHMPRGASIINSASVVAYQGSASLLEYSSTKGAIVAFTRSLAQQLAPKGIRVNAVAPGPIHTPLNPATREQQNLEKWLDKPVPLGRIGQPSECGTSYVFLASQESTYFTGQVLHPNGGYVVNG